MKLLFATNNPGKKAEIAALGKRFGVEVFMLSDLRIESEPEETGETFKENAQIKVQDLLEGHDLPDDIWVAGDDSGAVIPALNNEPGVRTARWSGKKLPTQEMAEFIVGKTSHLREDERGVKFISVVALAKKNKPIRFFKGEVSGVILRKPRQDIGLIEGFPWRQVFYRPDVDEMLGEKHTGNTKPENYTHRERAFVEIFEYIRDNS